MQAADNRGEAVCCVSLLPDDTVHVRGYLADGQRVDYALGERADADAELVGHLEPAREAPSGGAALPESLPPQRFVKAKLASGEYLLCNVSKGFITRYWQVSEAAVRKLLGLAADGGGGGMGGSGDGRSTATDMSAPARGSTGRASTRGMRATVMHVNPLESALAEDVDEMMLHSLVEHTFDAIDRNHDGTLSAEELAAGLESNPALVKLLIGADYAPPSPGELMANMDTSKDGKVSLDEFTAHIAHTKTKATHRRGKHRARVGAGLIENVVRRMQRLGSVSTRASSYATEV